MVLAVQGEPPARREAATALGRIGDAAAVPALLDSLAAPVDRFLEHATIFALIRIDDREATEPRAGAGQFGGAARALIALDQMDGGRLAPSVSRRC